MGGHCNGELRPSHLERQTFNKKKKQETKQGFLKYIGVWIDKKAKGLHTRLEQYASGGKEDG